MDVPNKEDYDRGVLTRYPHGGDNPCLLLLPPPAARDPAFDCCCGDGCPGVVGGEQCNARDADANASTAFYLDTGGQGDKYLCGDRLACHLDGDTDRNDSSNRDDCDHAATDPGTESDCGHRAAAHGRTA